MKSSKDLILQKQFCQSEFWQRGTQVMAIYFAILGERNQPVSGKGTKGGVSIGTGNSTSSHNQSAVDSHSTEDHTDSGIGTSSSATSGSNSDSKDHTWINDIFQGILTSETRCLNCETVSTVNVKLSKTFSQCQNRLCFHRLPAKKRTSSISA